MGVALLFLFLVAVVGAVVVLVLFPLLRPLLRRLRRPIGRILPVAALVLVGLLIALLFRALIHGHLSAPTWVFFFFLLVGLTFVFVWKLDRSFRRPAPAGPAEPCPPIPLLKNFLGDRSPPAEHARLAAHLETCTACQHRVEGLTAGQAFWTGMASRLAPQAPAAAPALRQVIDSLKGGKNQDETRDEPAFSADLPLGFLSPSDRPGHLGRLDRYEVLEEIGRGGMGVVLKAFDPSLHRVVAIKVLAPQLATSGVARKRFLREAKAAAAVTHDHIVTIHAVDEANGLPYLVMHYVAGLSLQQRIDREGPLADPAEILRIGIQAASALAAAHDHGIVHRDVKPANILLEDGVQRVKITDFGLARAMDDASLTQSGVVAGSPPYMAPEQARGEALDHRADLFSLGSVLYTACTGRPPFRAANTLAVLRRVCDDTPRPIRETNPEVPDWLAAVVEKLMAKDPADRFASAAEVVEVLGRHLAALQHRPWVPPPAAAGPADMPTSVTLCPSCGASLHVPERMVGKTVHCAECGAAFPVENASEEILVARAAPSPFPRRAGVNRKRRTWALGLGVGGALLLPLLVLSCVIVGESTHPPLQAPAMTPATVLRSKQASFWKNALARFPAEATLFGAIDLEAFGSLSLADEWTQVATGLALSPEAREALAPENLGRVRIDGLSAAYYDDPKTGNSTAMVQLEGVALDGRKRILDALRGASAGALQVAAVESTGLPDRALRVSAPGLPFALGIVGDQRIVLTRSTGEDGKGDRHARALERLPGFEAPGAAPGVPSPENLLSGYNPPWVQTALDKIPPDACGLLLGEIPVAWRKRLAEEMRLRACPRTFALTLKRQGDGVALALDLHTDKAGAERTLRDDLENWRRLAPDDLKARHPAVRRERNALALLEHALRTMRFGANPGSGTVSVTVHLPGQTCAALRTLGKCLSTP